MEDELWKEEATEEEDEEPGVSNQKQEPHTKMWEILIIFYINYINKL